MSQSVRSKQQKRLKRWKIGLAIAVVGLPFGFLIWCLAAEYGMGWVAMSFIRQPLLSFAVLLSIGLLFGMTFASFGLSIFSHRIFHPKKNQRIIMDEMSHVRLKR